MSRTLTPLEKTIREEERRQLRARPATAEAASFVITGAPVPWARAGSDGRAGGRRFTKPAQGIHMRTIREAWQSAGAPWLGTGPVTITFQFHIERPASHYRRDELRHDAPAEHTQTPDLSNLEKLIEDALNGLLYLDDAQIVEKRSRKRWADRDAGLTSVSAARCTA